MLKDTILRLDDIPTRDDTSIYTFDTDFRHHTEYYRLYKKKDGLYYVLNRNKNDGELTNIMTLFEESKQGSLDIERTLGVLQKFLIQKIKELESKIIELMKLERIKVLIKSKKYVDFYDAQPSYMLIYRKSLREIENNIGTKKKNIYYITYNK